MAHSACTQYTLVTLHAIAILSTLFRLGHRARIRKLWWDDFWAAVSMLTACVTVAMLFMDPANDLKNSLKTRSICRYANFIAFTVSLWASRVSVAVTIVRLLPRGRIYWVAKGMALFFCLLCMGLVVQKLSMCGGFGASSIGCIIPTSTAIIEVCTDIVGDVWLLGAPIFILRQMTLPWRHTRLLIFIFATSIFTSIIGILHAIFIFIHFTNAIGISAHAEMGISLIVCNLLVVVTYFYSNFFRRMRGVTVSTQDSTDETNSISTYPPPTVSPDQRTMITFTDISTGFTNSDMSSSGGMSQGEIKSLSVLPSVPVATLSRDDVGANDFFPLKSV